MNRTLTRQDALPPGYNPVIPDKIQHDQHINTFTYAVPKMQLWFKFIALPLVLFEMQQIKELNFTFTLMKYTRQERGQMSTIPVTKH